MGKTKDAAKSFIYFAILYLVGFGIYQGYVCLDSLGWISHREETVITAQSDWLAGESKDCWSAPNDYYTALAKKYGGVSIDKSGKVIDDSMAGYVMSTVTCDHGPEHKMKVTFYGRKIQDDYKVVTWRCMKGEDSIFGNGMFTCYQTGGYR